VTFNVLVPRCAMVVDVLTTNLQVPLKSDIRFDVPQMTSVRTFCRLYLGRQAPFLNLNGDMCGSHIVPFLKSQKAPSRHFRTQCLFLPARPIFHVCSERANHSGSRPLPRYQKPTLSPTPWNKATKFLPPHPNRESQPKPNTTTISMTAPVYLLVSHKPHLSLVDRSRGSMVGEVYGWRRAKQDKRNLSPPLSLEKRGAGKEKPRPFLSVSRLQTRTEIG